MWISAESDSELCITTLTSRWLTLYAEFAYVACQSVPILLTNKSVKQSRFATAVYLFRYCTVCTVGWGVTFFFWLVKTGQFQQRSGMIWEVQIQLSLRVPAHLHSSFYFKKILGSLNINIFVKIGMIIEHRYTIYYPVHNPPSFSIIIHWTFWHTPLY